MANSDTKYRAFPASAHCCLYKFLMLKGVFISSRSNIQHVDTNKGGRTSAAQISGVHTFGDYLYMVCIYMICRLLASMVNHKSNMKDVKDSLP